MTEDDTPGDPGGPPDYVNQVVLRGRFGGPAEIRTLPSGDELCVFRVTVQRPAGSRRPVDSIECVTAKAAVRRSALRREIGDLVAVEGSLHRRFWRTPAGATASRYEVEVRTLRLGRPGGPGLNRPDRRRPA
jgi:single-strand DNA-binding protein